MSYYKKSTNDMLANVLAPVPGLHLMLSAQYCPVVGGCIPLPHETVRPELVVKAVSGTIVPLAKAS